jgi:hypothetical protein
LDVGALDIDPVNHKADLWADGQHAFSSTPLAYCAAAVPQILKHLELFKNKRVFVSPFEATQRQVIAELERQQGVKYSITAVNDQEEIQKAQEGWELRKDIPSAYRLVAAGVLLPEYKSGFATAGKEPLLERLVEMPKITLEDVVREKLQAMAAAA